MNTLEATFRIVTPMFMSGADQQNAELRGPSIKGALRFWWRALNWDRIFIEQHKNDRAALEQLRNEESLLFGTANSGKGRGQSQILLHLTYRDGPTEKGNDLLLGKPSEYLGMGLFSMGGDQRVAIPADTTFGLKILHKKLEPEQKNQLEQALKAIGFWAGLGSRNRNGFGSLAIESLNRKKIAFTSQTEYLKAIEEVAALKNRCGVKPIFSAFSNLVDIITLKSEESAEKALNSLANKYKNFRSDYKHEPLKKYFGLPLEGYSDKRRASPLFFHVHPVGDQFLPVILKIPADFHPDYQKEENYSLVDEFMASLQ